MRNKHHILLSIGCNTNCEKQMERARERLIESFPGIVVSDAITTPAYGKEEGALPYSNMLAEADTLMEEQEIVSMLKEMESELGDSVEKRNEDIIMMDIDLLEYDAEKRHERDWQRPYVKELLSMIRKGLIVPCFMVVALVILLTDCQKAIAQTAGKETRKQDSELFAKAVEYYQGGKYHETIIAFKKLQKHYRLTPRFLAFLGYSYYKEQNYDEAISNLKSGIPDLKQYSPQEQAVYIYACAESLFNTQKYNEAIEYYSLALPLTEGNDKGDVLFHTAFAYYLMENHRAAYPLFTEALELYRTNTSANDELHLARLSQTEKMLRWLKKEIGNNGAEEELHTDKGSEG